LPQPPVGGEIRLGVRRRPPGSSGLQPRLYDSAAARLGYCAARRDRWGTPFTSDLQPRLYDSAAAWLGYCAARRDRWGTPFTSGLHPRLYDSAAARLGYCAARRDRGSRPGLYDPAACAAEKPRQLVDFVGRSAHPNSQRFEWWIEPNQAPLFTTPVRPRSYSEPRTKVPLVLVSVTGAFSNRARDSQDESKIRAEHERTELRRRARSPGVLSCAGNAVIFEGGIGRFRS
jgi:hypothetical protein